MRLQEGNSRFLTGGHNERNWPADIQATASGQSPYAVILSCMDSRAPVETVFDQGLGDIFTIRIAGNVLNADVLGSMEFGCKLAGARAVLVMGHTSCGAVKGCLSGTRLGSLTGLVKKIEPAAKLAASDLDPEDPGFGDLVAEINVRVVLEQIGSRSPTLREMHQAGEVGLYGAMYDIATGRVRFLD